MPKVTVWKCPHTSKYFEDERLYRNHLKRLSRKRIAARKWQEVTNNVFNVIAGAQTVNNFQELVDYIIEHQQAFIINGVFNEGWDDSIMQEAMDKGYNITFPEIQFLSINATWRPDVSNSHVCPRNGKTNWGGQKKNVPRHYPGWHGRLEIYWSSDNHIIVKKPGSKKIWKIIERPPISKMTAADFGERKSHCGVNTGSGGGGIRHQSYEVSLFQSDFPEMEKKVMFATLQGKGEKANWGVGLRYKELDELGVGKFGEAE